MHAVTVPDALFAENKTGPPTKGGVHEQQQQVLAISSTHSEGDKNVQTARSKGRRSNMQKEQREEPGTSVKHSGRGLNGTSKREPQKPHFTSADAIAAHPGDVGEGDPTLGDTDTVVREDCQDSPRKVDRFGRKIKVVGSADRKQLTRLGGSPEGTLLALGWGWGGEFRIGTGRNGFEVQPRPLHPEFKVRCYARCLALKPRFEKSG